MTLTTLDELFALQLNQIYDAETRISSVMPTLALISNDEGLKNTLVRHLKEQDQHIRRLENILASQHLSIGSPDLGSPMALGLTEDAELITNAEADPRVRDVAIISVVQRMKHFEIACYGTLATLSHHLGLDLIQQVLRHSMEEEFKMDSLLTRHAEGTWLWEGVNHDAAKACG